MTVGHTKLLYQAAPGEIVRFYMITESCRHPHWHQKMGIEMCASLLVYHYWMLHEECMKQNQKTIC